MNVTYAAPELWTKYGLCHSRVPVEKWWGIGSEEDINRYYDLVEKCHDAVSFYWEKYPEEAIKRREIGHMYFDVAKKLVPEELEEATALAEEYRVREDWWTQHCRYMATANR